MQTAATGGVSPATSATVQFNLPNGLRVVIIPQPDAAVAAISVVYHVGSADAPPEAPALNDSVAELLARRVTGLTAGQLARLTEALGGRFQHTVDEHTTWFSDEVAAGDVETTLRLEAARMAGFGQAQADWNAARSVLLQTAAGAESTYTTQARALVKAALLAPTGAGVGARRDPYANLSALERETFDQVERFRSTWYVPNNALLVVAGNVNPASVADAVRRYFGSLPARPLPARGDVTFSTGGTSGVLSVPAHLVVRAAMVCVREPGPASADFAAAQILNDAMTSKSGALTALVNDNRAISTELLPVYLRGNVAIYCAHGVVAYDGDQAALRRDLEAVFEHYARAGLTADEVQAARTLELVVYRLDEADPAGMAGLWRSQVGQYGFHTPDAYINLFAAVTPAEVDRVARTWFVPHNMVSVETVFGAPKVVTPEVASQSREEAPPLPDWAHAAATSTANGFRPPQPMQTTLPNGIRVIAIDRPSSGIVQVYGHVQVYPPLATAPGLEGVDQVLAALFPYGPSTMSPAAFARALDAIGGHESAGQGFQLAVLPGDLDRGLRLLAANEINPTFDAVAFERAQATARERTSAMVVSLAAAAFKWVMRHLYPPGDPSQRIPTPDSIAALTVDDVRAYFAAAFRPERTTIVISGDVTPRRAIDAVARAFGGWTSSTVPAAPLDFPSVSPNTARTSYLPTPDLPLQIGFMGQTLDVSPASADYESLTAGFYVLGGSHGWLARDVVDAGLGMQATLTAEIGRQRSDLIIAYACAPQNAGRVHSIILADISRLQQRPLSAAELAAVKAQLVRRQILEADEDETLAQSYFALVDNGLPLEELARRAERYAALTPADIQNAMVRHVRRNGFVDLIVGPHVPL